MDISKLVDFCMNTKGAVSDVATVAAKVLSSKFRYVGDNVWEYKADDTVWCMDVNREKLEMAVKIDVCQAFMERALHWQEQSLCTDISEKIDCQLRSQFLLQICMKFRKEKFVKDVIKELRAFLVNDSE
jgi:hypothetical protein